MGAVLVTGAAGQIGTELTSTLRDRYGSRTVVASDVEWEPTLGEPYERVDVTERSELSRVISEYGVDTVYHLAALLSAEGERDPARTFDVNVGGLNTLLAVGQRHDVDRVVVPSSIAVYGPETPEKPDERAFLFPTTMYGVTKVVAEHLGRYYSGRTELDVRGVRFPGIVSHETRPSGGTTDYAVNAFYDAVDRGEYTYFVREDTRLPMVYMADAVRALVRLAEADRSDLRFHCEYNVMGLSFTAGELTARIRERVPDFRARYEPDERQEIADSWPAVLDDTAAREDWEWSAEYDLDRIADDMLANLRR